MAVAVDLNGDGSFSSRGNVVLRVIGQPVTLSVNGNLYDVSLDLEIAGGRQANGSFSGASFR
ncbi:MAG: hypothetical protein ACRBC3_08980 [Burkholderiaceae bacterium]